MGFYGEYVVRGVKNGIVEQLEHGCISKWFAETWRMPTAYAKDEMFNPHRKFDYYFKLSYDFLLKQLKELDHFENTFLLQGNIQSIKNICKTITYSEIPIVSDLQYLKELIQDNLSAKEEQN